MLRSASRATCPPSPVLSRLCRARSTLLRSISLPMPALCIRYSALYVCVQIQYDALQSVCVLVDRGLTIQQVYLCARRSHWHSPLRRLQLIAQCRRFAIANRSKFSFMPRSGIKVSGVKCVRTTAHRQRYFESGFTRTAHDRLWQHTITACHCHTAAGPVDTYHRHTNIRSVGREI